jgi:F0F1-type ATP synthase membrane subunit a
VIAPLILSLILLGILESAVAVIQAYVFRVLMTLYVNEVNSPQIRR